jgi:spore coat polysaccharide biosynthesis protein SpsF
MNAGVIIQARYSSRRLPGKVLRPLHGKPLVGWLIERMLDVPEARRVVLATSDRPEDDALADYAQTVGASVHRGPLDDVLARFLGAAEAFGLEVAVRVSGDSPLLDPRLVTRALRLFGEGSADLVSNVVERTFPPGQSVEALSVDALRMASARAAGGAEREHVTPYFYAHPDQFRIRGFRAARPAAEVRLCVDTEADFSALARLVSAMRGPARDYGVEELVELHRALEIA